MLHVPNEKCGKQPNNLECLSGLDYMNGITERKEKESVKRQQQQEKNIKCRPIKTFVGNSRLKTFYHFRTHLGENQMWEYSWDSAQLGGRIIGSYCTSHLWSGGSAGSRPRVELKVAPREGHSLTSLTIQVEIKDPRILFK